MSKYIVFIHQSSELYGSDKTLYALVKATKKNSNYEPLVVLPEHGPLNELLKQNGIEVITMPVLKVSRSMFKLSVIVTIPFKVLKLTRNLHKALKGRDLEFIHSNTIAVLLGAFYAKLYGVKHLWHIHEIIEKPKSISKLFSWLIYHLSDLVVYNSKATMTFWCEKKNKLTKKSQVILNGLDRTSEPLPLSKRIVLRKQLFNANKNDLVIALIGRINKWKGQQLLLESFKELNKHHEHIKLVFVGSTFKGMEFLHEELKTKIKAYDLENKCKIVPFQKEIFPVWDSIDIAVVPSTEPEPFGLVAVEAMLCKKPVVAANHGGLKEIVANHNTGYLFEPNNIKDLTSKISLLIKSPHNIKSFGENGYQRAISTFSLQAYEEQFIKTFDNLASKKKEHN